MWSAILTVIVAPPLPAIVATKAISRVEPLVSPAPPTAMPAPPLLSVQLVPVGITPILLEFASPSPPLKPQPLFPAPDKFTSAQLDAIPAQ